MLGKTASLSANVRILVRLIYYNETQPLIIYPPNDPASNPMKHKGAEKGSWGPWK